MHKNMLKLAKAILSLASVETDKGILTYEGELEVGTEVYLEDENGELVPAADGEYATEDKIIVVAEGKVAEIREREEIPVDPEPESDPEPEPDPEEPLEIQESEEEQARIAELEGIVAERDARIAELEAELEAARAEIAEKDAKLKESEEMSAKDKLKMSKQTNKNSGIKFSNFC